MGASAVAEGQSQGQLPASGSQATAAPAASNAPALAALCAIARLHQVAADPATLAHQLGLQASEQASTDDLLRCARHLGLKARRSTTTIDRLPLIPLPALALVRQEDGTHAVVLAQCDGQRVLFQDMAAAGCPTIEALDVFAAHWTGEVISLPAAPAWPANLKTGEVTCSSG